MALGNAVVFLGVDLTGLNKGLGDAERNVNRHFGQIMKTSDQVGRHMATAGKAMVGLGVAAAGAMGFAAAKAMEFEKGLSNVATLGVGDLGKLREGLNGLRIEYALTTKGTQELYDAISAGVREDAAIGVLEQAARGARAGVGELASALDAGTSIMNAYGLKGADAAEQIANMEEIQGKLTTAIKFGKTTMDDIGGSVGRVASLSKEAGVSVDELLASVAGLTATGSPATEQISALRQTIATILKPSKEAADLSAALGIEFDAQALKAKGLIPFLRGVREQVEAQGAPMAARAEQLRGMVEVNERAIEAQKAEIQAVERSSMASKQKTEVLKGLRAGLADMRTETKGLKDELDATGGATADATANMAKLFGSVESANAVLAITGSQAEVVTSALGDMENAQQNLSDAFERGKENDPSFMYTQAKNRLAVLTETIGRAVIPAINELLVAVTPLIQAFSVWVAENPELVATLGGVAAALAPAGALLIGMSSMIGFVNQMVVVIPKLNAGLRLLTGAQVAAGGAGLVGGTGLLGVAGALVAIAGVGAAGWAFGRWLDSMTEKIERMNGPLGALARYLTLVPRTVGKLGDLAGDLVTPDKSAPFLGPGSYPGLAVGTGYAPAGLAMVGERGPELVRMRGGERVWDAGTTDRIIEGLANLKGNGGGGGIHIHGGLTVVANDPDEMKRRLLHQARMAGGVL